MNLLFEEFKERLDRFDKDSCTAWVQEVLQNNRIDLSRLYLEVFEPCLTQISDDRRPQVIDIWEEHLRSSIVRTMIELCHPYVLQERDRKNPEKAGTVLFCCLEEEQHEIGARMASDFLTLSGFHVFFVGAGTSKEEIAKAVMALKPDFTAISISNFFHLTKLQQTIDFLRLQSDYPVKIVVGGYAVTHTPLIEDKVTPDLFIYSVADLEKMKLL